MTNTTEPTGSTEPNDATAPVEPTAVEPTTVELTKSPTPTPPPASTPVPDTAPTPAPAPTPPVDNPWAVPTPTPAAPGPWSGDSVWAIAPEVLSSDEARKPRRAALLLRGAAVLILLLSGTAAAVAVTASPRTDIPGLATPNDGRYVFPALALPPLPAGKAAPHDSDQHLRHYADLRQLLLPAPQGATLAAPAAGATGWVPCTDYATQDADPAKLTAQLAENACRAATKRVWTAKDGTRTEIWLLRFGSAPDALAFYGNLNTGDRKDMPGLQYTRMDLDARYNGSSAVRSTGSTAGSKNEPVGRAAYVQVGDVTEIVSMSNPKGVPLQAFRQVTVLQADLLY